MAPHFTAILPVVLSISVAGQDQLPRWYLDPEPILRLGVVTGPREQEFAQVVAARVAKGRGVVLVADRRLRVIRVFDSTGVHVRSFGREGSGPREFRSIDRMFIDRDTVHVVDGMLGRITTWLVNGILVRTRPIPQVNGQLVSIEDRCDGGAYLVHTLPRAPRQLGMRQTHVDVLRVHDRWRRARFGSVVWGHEITIQTGWGTTTYPAALAPEGRIACAGGGVWYAEGREAEVSRIGIDGAVLEHVTLPIAPQPLTSAEKDAHETGWVGSVPERYRPRLRSALRQMAYPETLPSIEFMHRAANGDVWLTPALPAEASVRSWYVLSATGQLTAYVETPREWEILDVDRKYVLAKQKDAFDVEQVAWYRVTSREL